MKYSKLEYAIKLFHKLAQENLDENVGEKELAEVNPDPEFDKLVNTINTKDLIPTVPNDGNYSRDVPKGFPIHIAMVDSVVVPGGLLSKDKPALLLRVGYFANEVQYQRRPGYPKQRIKFSGPESYMAYALELVALAGGTPSLYDFEYIRPDGNIKHIKNKNSNFNQWVLVTFKEKEDE